MAVTFNIPSSPKKNVMEINNFLGVDLSNTGANISQYRSPYAPNMIRDVPGKVRKRMGYEKVTNISDEPVIAAYPYKDFSAESLTNLYSVNRIKDFTPNQVITDPIKKYSVYEPIPGSPCKAAFLITYNTLVASDVGREITITIHGDKGDITRYLILSEELQTARINNISTGITYIEIANSKTSLASIHIEELFACNVASEEPLPEDFEYSITPESIGDAFYVNNLYISSENYKENLKPYPSGSVDYKYFTSLFKYGDFKAGTKIDVVCDEFIPSYPDYVTNYLPSGKVVKIKGFISAVKSGRDDYEVPDSTILGITSNNIFYPCLYLGYHEQASSYWETFEFYAAVPPGQKAYVVVKYEGVYIKRDITSVGFMFSEVEFTEVTPKPFYRKNVNYSIVHAGTKLYTLIGNKKYLSSSNMGINHSNSWQIDNNVYIADGSHFKKYEAGSSECYDVYNNEKTYVPTITIAKSPSGGGTSYESLNLLSDWYIETYNTDNTPTARDFYPSIVPLDDTDEYIDKFEVWKLWAGEWRKLTRGVDYGIGFNRISLISDPGTSPVTGEDNIKIKVKRKRTTPNPIDKCSIGTIFGVNGAADRLFLSGNPEFPNYDWFSEYRDFTYFPDDSYSKIGSDSSAIMGYSHVGNLLATHKDRKDAQQSVVFRKGDLIDNKASFPIINALQGEGAISTKAFNYLETEPLFLTQSGIYALTTQDITGERYSQNRSFYLNGALTEENNLENAFSVVYKNMYWLFINNLVYVLDGLQATQTEKSEPYSTRQYVGYLLTDIHATCAWVDGEDLLFGDASGNIYKFYTDETAAESYNDDGLPITSWWETPDIDGNLFYKNKTFRYMAVRLKSSIGTKVKLWNQTRGIWNFIKESKLLSNKVFAFSGVTFSTFTFNRDTSDPLVSTKLRVKKMDKARFKIENSNLNEPFGIQNIAFEYVESGNFKG